jgi:hypothetical protein
METKLHFRVLLGRVGLARKSLLLPIRHVQEKELDHPQGHTVDDAWAAQIDTSNGLSLHHP